MRHQILFARLFAVAAIGGIFIGPASRLLIAKATAEAERPVATASRGAELDQKATADGELFERLEWRGIFSLGDEAEFSLFDPAERRGFWISRKKPDGGIQIVLHDPAEKTLTIRLGERIRKLTLAGGGITITAPSVLLIPAAPEEANGANDVAGPNTPTVRMVPPDDAEDATPQGTMEEAPMIELSPPAEDDEMLLRSDSNDQDN